MKHDVLSVARWRDPMIESAHLVDAVLLDVRGNVIEEWGDAERLIYPRSAIKLIQGLPLIESGAADAYRLSDAELALACASHSGQSMHVKTVAAWLSRCGIGAELLHCGGHLPFHEPSAHAMIRQGEEPAPLHNMCSGKHTGMLCTAKHLGEDMEGYFESTHPVQVRVRDAIAELTDEDLSTGFGIDGCGIPTYATTLKGLALAAARMADPRNLGPTRGQAIERLRRAYAREPLMMGGEDRYDSDVNRIMAERVSIKAGADGVSFAVLAERGQGLALKVRDGERHSAGFAAVTLLDRLGVLDDEARAALKERLEHPLRNWAGTRVGRMELL